MNLKPIGITYILYERDNLFAEVLAYSSLIPIFLVVGFATVLFFRRELHTASFFTGQLLCEVLNLILKFIIKQPRPDGAHELGKTGYGMPSDHAQFSFFFAVYCTLFLFYRVHLNETRWKYIGSITINIVAGIIAYSRVYLGLHTYAQVLVGTAVGCAFAVIWFILTQRVFSKYLFPVLEELPICKQLYIRDSTSIPNVLQAEYQMSRKLRQKAD